MALTIIDARKSGFPHDGLFGYVHLIFDQDIDADPLRLSVLKIFGREYLGQSSPPKANWRPTRWHFFDAPLVSRGDGRTVFRLGPEVTSFIPDESMLEIASEDNAIRETAVWSGVSHESSWRGPPAQAEPAPQPPPRPLVVRQQHAEQPRPTAKPPAPPAQPSPVSTTSASPMPPAPSSEVRPLSPFAWAQAGTQPEPSAEPPAQPPPASTTSTPPELAAEPALPTQEPADTPALAGQPEPSAPPPSPLQALAASALPETDAERAFTMAASLTSGVVFGEEPVAPEPISTTATQGEPETSDLPASPTGRNRRPVVLAAVALLAGAIVATAWGTQNRDYLCDSFQLFCDLDLVAYREAQACAAPKTCGAGECVTRYRDGFPNGRFNAQIDDIAVSKGRACEEPSRADPLRPGEQFRCDPHSSYCWVRMKPPAK